MTNIVPYNDKQVFGDIIQPLEQMFEPLNDERRDIYYKHLKGKDRTLLKQAVTYLVNNHTYKRFPLLKEISNAIGISHRARLKGGASRFNQLQSDCECRMCNCTGFVLFEKKYPDTAQMYTTTRHCECEVGRWLQASTSKSWAKGRQPVSEEVPPAPQPTEPSNDFI